MVIDIDDVKMQSSTFVVQFSNHNVVFIQDVKVNVVVDALIIVDFLQALLLKIKS